MEEEKIVEQPQMEQANALNQAGMSAESECGSTNNNGESFEKLSQNDEQFGKFKNAQDLLDAYQNLQKEFTRKSQRLSELEKDKTENSNPSAEKLQDGLDQFLSKNSDAKEYSQQIMQKVASNSEEDSFENAWAKIILDNLANKDSQKSNPLVKKIVFDDENLKNSVIEIYMRELQEKKPPILLNSDVGATATKPETVVPASLNDAKKLMEDMFS